MQPVVLIKDKNGNFTVAEVSNYTYTNEATARAFARDKWGDENPVVVIAGNDFVPAWRVDPEKVAEEAERLIQTDPKYKEILDDRELGTYGGEYQRHPKYPPGHDSKD